jgi:Lar family restriction alleviation protein
MMDKLKPCPFCGGEAFVVTVAEPSVQCLTCPTSMVGETDAEAIAAWNTRTQSGSNENAG